MDTYDRRLKTANMNLQNFYWARWQKVLEQQRKLEAAASLQSLKEAKHMLSNLGLDLDLSKSNINTYRVGSDSWGHDVWMTMRDMWDRGSVLTADVIKASVFDACLFEPKEVTPAGRPGEWIVQASWGG